MPRQFVYHIGGSGTPMTQAEKDNNIMCIYDQLKGNYNWTDEAIAGACGCFHEESWYNPGIYESSHGGNLNNLPYFAGGMGLAQWTDYPAYSGTYPNPLPWAAMRDGYDWYDGDYQCYLMNQCTNPTYTDMGFGQGARWGWQTSNRYPSIPFTSYIANSSMSVEQAVTYWFYDFEWHYWEIPSWVDFPARVAWGEYAYALFHGQTPDPPTPPGPGPGPEPPPGPGPSPILVKKMPVWFMLKPYYKK